MSPLLSSIFASAACNIAAGMLVLFRNPRSRAHQSFCIFTLGSAVWMVSFGATIAFHTDRYLLPLNVGGLVLVFGLTEFTRLFPRPQSHPLPAWLFWAPLVLGGGSMAATNLIVLHVATRPDGTLLVTHGPLACVWSLLLLAYILVSLKFLTTSYVRASPYERDRLRLVFFGTAAFAMSAVVFDAILPDIFGIASLDYLGPLSSLIFLLATAYAILAHEFMDIRIVIQRSVIYSCSFFLLAVLYTLVLTLIEHFFESVVSIAAPLSAGITLFMSMYTFPRMEIYFRKITDPIFFKERYDYFEVLEGLSHTLNTNLSLRPLIRESLSTLDQAFRPAFIHFIRSGTAECYTHQDCSFDSMAAEAGYVIPVRSGPNTLGTFFLGPKRSGDAYTAQDAALLRTFGSNATVAFEKAELYQKLREHTEELESKVQERTRHLQEMQQAQRDLFDNISHALQTPLTVLKSGFELTQRRTPAKTLSAMRASIDDLSRLIGSILTLARIDSHPLDAQFSEVSLSALIERLVEYVGVIAEAADIRFTAETAPGIHVQAEEKQLEEALINILSNAVKYTARAATRSISLSLRSGSGHAYITIADSGIGMSGAQVERMFDRFYRAPHAGNAGYGLGLAITKRIIDRHGGSIAVESEPGRGTTMTVTIPCTITGQPRTPL